MNICPIHSAFVKKLLVNQVWHGVWTVYAESTAVFHHTICCHYAPQATPRDIVTWCLLIDWYRDSGKSPQ